ncbi:MAG: adenosylcobinamide-phosphate synthase CbiB [Marinibacterium sp.]|nr:adenosylcobinamide-phosphate synthase CbiB [Marinibacterium sp.]
MSHAALLIPALILDALLGEPDWLWSRLPHPAVLFGRVVGWLDRTLNRGALRRLRGVAALGLMMLVGWAIGAALAWLGPVAEILAAAILLAQRSLVEHVRAVADGLRQSLDQGRTQVGWIVSRDTAEMTEAQVARSAIESAAENLSDGVVAPAFWFLILGAPGLVMYKMVNTADSMIGYRTPRHAAFGWAAARMDDLLNLIPARLTGLTIAALGGILRRWPAITADARRHKSPNAGWPEAAMARCLNVALAGPRSYDGQMRDLPWVHGPGQKEIGAPQIDASLCILWQVWGALFVAACFGAGLAAVLG